MLENFGLAVLLIRTSGTFIAFKREKHLPCFLVIPAGFWYIPGRTARYFGSVFAELKGTHDWVNVFSGQIRCDQIDVIVRSGLCVFHAAVSTICDQQGFLVLLTDLLQVLFQEFAVAFVVCIELVIRDD